jgi:hypothetical protein
MGINEVHVTSIVLEAYYFSQTVILFEFKAGSGTCTDNIVEFMALICLLKLAIEKGIL